MITPLLLSFARHMLQWCPCGDKSPLVSGGTTYVHRDVFTGTPCCHIYGEANSLKNAIHNPFFARLIKTTALSDQTQGPTYYVIVCLHGSAGWGP